jgi:hypothetical protein
MRIWEVEVKVRAVCACAGVCAVCTIATLSADTLVLKDGRRIDGLFVGARDGVIEFERARPQGGRERVSIDRVDVVRIELDEGAPTTSVPPPAAGGHTRDVVVDARTGWTDGGIDVAAGQVLSFYATDRIRWAPGEVGLMASTIRRGPGVRCRTSGAALIGRIGVGREYFLVGSRRGGSHARPAACLGVNDESLDDNAGSFRVTIATGSAQIACAVVRQHLTEPTGVSHAGRAGYAGP